MHLYWDTFVCQVVSLSLIMFINSLKYYLKEQLPTVLEAFAADLLLSHTNTFTENFPRFSAFSKSNRKLIVKLCNHFCGKKE